MKFLKNVYGQLFYIVMILLGLLAALGGIVLSIPISLYAKVFREKSNNELFEEIFHRAISMIELHQVRFGHYPENLSVPGIIQYLVADDFKIISTVLYRKVDSGYELNIGTDETIKIKLPRDFWQGLGIIKTNVDGGPNPSNLIVGENNADDKI